MKNIKQLAKKINKILENANYHDLYENIYDDTKQWRWDHQIDDMSEQELNIRLKDFLVTLENDSDYIDNDGKLKEIQKLLQTYFML